MKKLIFLLGVIAITAAPVFADTPTAAGKMEITAGSVLNYSFAMGDAVDASNYPKNSFKIGIFEPMNYGLGFFVIDNLALGGSLYYTNDKYDPDGEMKAWAIAPYAKFYIPINEQFLVDVKGSLRYDSIDMGSDPATRLSLGIGVGATYMIIDSFGITATFDYLTHNESEVDGTKNGDAFSEFVLGIGFTAFLGFSM